MGLFIVLEILGETIEDLQKENQSLKDELDIAKKNTDVWYQAYLTAQGKLEAAQHYADSLAEQCENVSKKEKNEESGC